jgi:hypothetical protein
MGFSGGGSNVLKPHTHDGNIAQDGGALDMDGVTQGSLTAGDLIYSDGSNLQRLAIGGSGQSLTSSGSAPQWSAASSAAMEILGSATAGASDHTLTVSFSAIDETVQELYCSIQGSMQENQDLELKVNGETTNYEKGSTYFQTVTTTNVNRSVNTGEAQWALTNQYNADFFSGYASLSVKNYGSGSTKAVIGNFFIAGWGSGSQGNNYFGGICRQSTSTITSLTLEMGGDSSKYFGEDTMFTVYKRNN